MDKDFRYNGNTLHPCRVFKHPADGRPVFIFSSNKSDEEILRSLEADAIKERLLDGPKQ